MLFNMLVMFIFWFCDEYFLSSCSSLYALKMMFDNSNLDMFAGRKIVIWAFFYLSNGICIMSLIFLVLVLQLTATIRRVLFYSWFHLLRISIFILFPWILIKKIFFPWTWFISIFNLFRDLGTWQLFYGVWLSRSIWFVFFRGKNMLTFLSCIVADWFLYCVYFMHSFKSVLVSCFYCYFWCKLFILCWQPVSSLGFSLAVPFMFYRNCIFWVLGS